MNLWAFLLGILGGLGSLIAFTLSPQIRAYNRISVFIAFFSLLALAACLDLLCRRHATTPRRRRLAHLLLALALAFGLFDQTSPTFTPDYAALSARFGGDERFVRRIEAASPPRTMIFQLPVVPFPEYPPVYKMTDYEQLRPYLHSTTLRWSYAAMKGREGDLWQQGVASKPLPDMLRALSAAGFRSIYVNGDGYPDNGRALVKRLTGLLGTQALVSEDGRLMFIPMKGH